MSERPTPETDAVAEKNIYGVACKVDVDFTRKLEQERDEAREALRTLAEHGESEIQLVTKERDEAIADLEFRRGLYKVLEGANNHLMTANQEVAKLARTLKQERDDAREALKKIKHIFINGGDAYVDFVKVGNIATDYLEGL